jgi:hypothetical protein
MHPVLPGNRKYLAHGHQYSGSDPELFVMIYLNSAMILSIIILFFPYFRKLGDGDG